MLWCAAAAVGWNLKDDGVMGGRSYSSTEMIPWSRGDGIVVVSVRWWFAVER